ncbi:MAG: diacylglyceryl transferase [Flavobacteriaceae bacterium CG_4_8_14_3_um_filter_34_10]|nr:diacylglyceryl transferase [Flavobacteriia bacterium]OIP48968.1 MAG: diacylglyceryl transferase [Flavobacteriaceae bacterium CG2_30_34_30]PIQ18473.1 MAG: diacylglyceryl transferase [Flavobacteriaceae bacterium CG18_big_fil_WC_8_21_14_2_50_34_36]PIV49759.1 MAG: diacylglyceryl transferase [Flavobacteriaceae bacterium CG02_land_8_20_14_3_00_34_13]PIX08225.1 MAG: diacylglyceryl transferase [Flavobacteriaceae bacterium CG_4_8_14_3_um_filter_34_10]PJC08103.1 MAG: diacylglyceryl transferase [Flavo
MKKLKARWGISSNWQLLTIFIVFGITGSTATKLGKPLTLLLGISADFWLFWPIRIILLFLAYQIILLIIGWLYGEIDFFWAFEKKMLRRFGFKNLDDAS